MIQLTDVTKTYAKGRLAVHALRGVTLHIADHGFQCIQGPSGSGKTTLLNVIGLLDEPTSGAIRLFDRDVLSLCGRERARLRGRAIGFVFQSFNLIPGLNAWQNVALPLYYAGVGRAERRSRAMKTLKSVDLQDRVGHFPAELSGGEEQRAAIARALVIQPRLVLADEPTGNLDTESGRVVMAQFARMHEEGKAILVATHDPLVLGYTSHHVTMRDGRVIVVENSQAT